MLAVGPMTDPERTDDEPTRVDGRQRRSERPRSEAPTGSADTITRVEMPQPWTSPSQPMALPQPDALSHASVTTLRETLHAQDAARTRSFALGTAAVAAVIALPLPWLGGDGRAKVVFGVTLALLLLVSLDTARRLRDTAAYSMRMLMRGAVLAIIAAFTGIHFFGAFSPAVVVVPFGLYFFGLAQSFAYTVGIYGTCSVAYAAMALPIALGWLPDGGLLRLGDVAASDAVVLVFAVEVVFFATYSVARLSRRASEHALADHDRAVRAIAGRDALLQEARLDLEGVLRARGLGRFTDECVGDYRLGRILGRGGMGEVYEGLHVDSEKPVAVKLLHPHILGDDGAVRRFLRECVIASSLDVPNVVKVLATSEPSDPVPFIAMERLEGDDLADLLRAHGRMRASDVVEMLRQVARGLEAAREAGIVHRDLKPRNLFCAQLGCSGDDDADSDSRALAGRSPRGVWKILDFGVSKLAGESTMTGQDLVGTPSYMAPEQAEGGEVTHATDLYALGVIAYRALTGRPAFSGESPAAILYQVVRRMPPRPTETGAQLDPHLDDALAIALAKDPADRFDSAHALADAIEQASRARLPSHLRRRAKAVREKHPWSE
jgi:eukaryotic-like serine/threonine-protein kinase